MHLEFLDEKVVKVRTSESPMNPRSSNLDGGTMESIREEKARLSGAAAWSAVLLFKAMQLGPQWQATHYYACKMEHFSEIFSCIIY